MRDHLQFYIDGAWTEPAGGERLEVVNPATEGVAGHIHAGSAEDVDRAVAAARRAFDSWSATSRDERLDLLRAIEAAYERRKDDIAAAISDEMGAPLSLARQAHAELGSAHLRTAIEVLRDYSFDTPRGSTLIRREPVGVCGFITPWNWPINQISAKVFPALAVGCTMVLKPSEVAPFSAVIFAEVLDEAGVPAGVFNLVHGLGGTVGAALASHPDVDLISFTGSTRAGIEVARNAAPSVKRVHQELGGKSPNVILDDADVAEAAARCMEVLLTNSGQSCNAPTRLLVPRTRLKEASEAAGAVARNAVVGDPRSDVQLGPVVSEAQWNKIQCLIEKGIAEGATLVAGGPGRPAGLASGYYVRPTVFADVTNDMTIAREEIFGPVLVIIPYDSEEDAVRIANDTPYGLAAYVQSGNLDRARKVAGRLRAGQVNINGAPRDFMAPFGGYKQSGNGREWGDHAFHEFLETKAVLGHGESEAA